MSEVPNPDTQIALADESAEGILPELNDLLTLTRPEQAANSLERLAWKYLKNPDGPAVIWTLRNSGSGKIVGFTACVPRRMMVDGEVEIAWNGADFSILPSNAV